MKGIYKITNKINDKFYIGSSMNLDNRIYRHKNELKNNSHKNKHLQAAYNKYGKENFHFEVLEILDDCNVQELRNREEFYLSSFDFSKMYNKTKLACGGSDVISIKCLVLDLEGNIVSEHDSLLQCALFYNKRQILSHRINGNYVIKKKYRVVTKEFYENNKLLIASWKNYTCEYLHKKLIYSKTFYKVSKNNENFYFKTNKEVGDFLNITPQMVSFIIIKSKKENNPIFHKKTGYFIEQVILN